MLTIDQLIESLNADTARDYAATHEPYLYVVWNLLDPNALSAYWVDRVEDRLYELMEINRISFRSRDSLSCFNLM